jgi:hypothetical protein
MAKKVLVYWTDSNSFFGWHCEDDYPEPAPVESIGFLVKDNEDYIVLGQSVGPGQRQNDIAILKRNIKQIINLAETQDG